MTTTETIVDSRGRPCPLPVIDLAKAVDRLTDGAEVVLLADDPGAASDVPAWCRMRGQELVEVTQVDMTQDGGHTRYRVRRRAAS